MADAKEKKKRERIVTPVARLSYPNLEKPDEGREYSDGKFKATFLFPKDGDLSKLKQAVANCAREEWGKDVDLKSILLPFKNGSEKEDEFYHPYIMITAKSHRKPGTVNMDREPMNPADIYGGCYVRANLTAFPYVTNMNVEQPDGKIVAREKKGVSFALNSVQFVRDGEPFGGSAANDFEEESLQDDFPTGATSTSADDTDIPF